MGQRRNGPYKALRRIPVLPVGIRSRLFLLIALVLLPSAAMLAWTDYQRYRALRDNELRAEMEVAQGVATTFATYVTGVREQLFTTAQAILTFSPYTRTKAVDLLTATATHFPAIQDFSWLGPDGTVLASSLPAMIGGNLAGSPYFQEIVAGHPWVISDLFREHLKNAPIFVIAVAARNEFGGLRGVVVARIGPEEVGALTLTQHRPERGALAIFDRQGLIVHLSPAESLTWEDRQRWREQDALLKNAQASGQPQTGLMTPALLEGEWLSARVPIAGIGWIAGAGRPADVAFAPVRRAILWDLTLAVLLTSAAFLLAYFLAGTIARPIRRLEHDAQVMGVGEIPPGDERLAPAEVRNLRRSVASMASSLVAAKETAEDASRTKSEFLANMSHELRTPMTVIMGSLEFLQRSITRPEERQLVDMAYRSADRLLGIIDDLLDISRIEAGRLKIEETSFDLRECVRNAVEMFTPRSGEKGVRLRWEVAPDTPSRARADPDRLRQVLVNLVGNAVKFTERGEIAVTVRHVGEELVFTVRDTGIGIPADKVGRLFHPFTQVDSSLTRRYGGTGLGLAICKELVELMGGAIWLESEEGRGSTFTFTLPWRPAEEIETSSLPPPEPEDARFPLRVLVVEDDPLVRDLVRMSLEGRGAHVVLAGNGGQAVARWQEGGIDLILMDLQMPDIDGLDATRRIRALEGEEQRTCIIALTAHARQEDRSRCLAAGMDGFLAKPLRLEELNSIIEKCPGREKPDHRPQV